MFQNCSNFTISTGRYVLICAKCGNEGLQRGKTCVTLEKRRDAHMDMDSLKSLLRQYTKVELSNKEQYLKGGDVTYNYAWGSLTDKEEQDSELFFVLTGLTDVFPEERYFQEGYDVSLLKHDRYAYPFPHKHTFFEIMYVYEGQFTHEVEGKRTVVNQGEICIVPPGVQHATHVFDDSIIIDILIKRSNFDFAFHSLIGKSNPLSDFFTKTLYSDNYKSWLQIPTGSDEDISRQVLELFLEITNENKYSKIILDHMLILLFYDILRKYEDQFIIHSINVYDDKLILILQYIKDNFTTVTLDELANLFYFNKYYLSRMIKQRTGSTFVEIVKKTRLDTAAQLVRNTNLHLWEIGHAVGYYDTTHLVRSFKKQFGMSPKDYRLKYGPQKQKEEKAL